MSGSAAPATETDVSRRSVVNVLWSYLSFAGTKTLNFVAVLILARLLGPAEFGTMALCIVAISYFEIIARFGLGSALVSRQDDLDAAADAVFLFAMASSGAMAAAMWFGAPAIADFFGTPALAAYLRVLCFAMMIEALAIVPATLLQKNLRFREKLVPDLLSSLIKGATAILLALSGFGVWALVWGYLAGAVASTGLRYWISPWWPRGRFDRRVAGDILRFGSHLLFAEILNAAQRNLDQLLIGKLLGPAALGLYTIAARIPDLAIRSFNQVTGLVIHPMMARMQAEPAALRQYYLGCLRYVALFTFTGGTMISLAADPLVRLLYTPEWYAMVFPMQCLALSLAIVTLDFLPGTIYKAIGKPKYLTHVSLLKIPVVVAVLYTAAPYGIDTVALVQIGLAVFYFVPNFLILRRVIGVTAGPTLAAILPAVAVSGTVALAGGLAGQLYRGLPIIELAVVGGAMAGAGVIALRLVAPEVLREVARMRPRRRAGVAA